jgi:hypothetical protein
MLTDFGIRHAQAVTDEDQPIRNGAIASVEEDV